ncbi:DUF2463 domain-containing protein [Encephalitozoon hellem]|uniref:DUF2463 domain-containing protein n=1 Tax=Encephalitozoon hellem TaxID=27973 RepID=A0A9Q9C8I9_ENCHE|nr:DUF2463 domain-containing protein [Encephalitozoon hellem]
MNVSINLPELDQTDEHTKEHRAALGFWDIIQICAAPVSMALPIIICSLLQRNTIHYNTLPKLAMSFPPFLYSGVHCLIMFNNNRKEQYESPSTLNSALAFLLNILLLLFSAISFLSIILSATKKWNQNIKNLLTILVFPFLVPSTYLLSTSCSLAQSNFHYTTTNTLDILLDLLILLSIPASIAIIPIFSFWKKVWIPCFVIILPILILIRSWREKYRPSAKYNGPTKIWRVATLIIILAPAIIAYGFIGFTSLYILNQTSSGPLKA